MPVPTPRDMVGQGRETDMRLTLLERRLASAGIPERLSPDGQEVADWHDVTAVGFYWSSASASNAPAWLGAPGWVGTAESHGGGQRILLTVGLPDGSGPRFVSSLNVATSTWSAWAYADATAGLPQPLQDSGNESYSFSLPAASWGIIPGSAEITFGSLPASLMVDLTYSAIAGTTTAAAYAMLGVTCQGGLTLNPEVEQDPAAATFSSTPFSNIPDASGSSLHNSIYGSKRVIVPAGSPITRFRLYARRNAASGTQRLNYSRVIATPVRWM